MEKIKKLFISWLLKLHDWLRTVEAEPDLSTRREEFVKKLRSWIEKSED